MLERIEKLRKVMKEEELDAFIVNSESNRFYLSGFSGSTGTILILKDKAYFVTDFRYLEQASKECPNYEVIDVAKYSKTYGNFYSYAMKENGLKTIGFEGNYTFFTDYSNLIVTLKDYELKSFNIDKIRLNKTKEEIENIKKAIEIAEEALEFTLKNVLKPGVSELFVSRALESKMIELGATKNSFDTIVASGFRGAMPHGVASDKIIKEGELVTFDFGCYYNGYASDITRTFAVGGKEVNEELIKIYHVVLEAQKRAVAAVKPGITIGTIDKIARDYIEKAGYGDKFGHTTGHGLGIAVHELPGVFHTNEEFLEPGMVITIEPGIYIQGLGGVRIEDDVLVSEKGHRTLTSYPKELITIG